MNQDDELLVIDITPIDKPIGIIRVKNNKCEKYLLKETKGGYLKLVLMEILNEVSTVSK